MTSDELLPCPLCGMHLRKAADPWMTGMLEHPPHVHCPISACCFLDRADLRAAWNRRLSADKARMDAGEPNARRDDIAAASMTYMCADCADEESEFCCHPADGVVVVGERVICREHAAKNHSGKQQFKVPDIAAKLRRQRMAIAAQTKRADKAEAALQNASTKP